MLNKSKVSSVDDREVKPNIECVIEESVLVGNCFEGIHVALLELGGAHHL